MTSRLVRMARVSADMERRSLPARSGAASIAQSEKCARSSLTDMPLPTSIMSGSFQCPGPAWRRSPSCMSRMRSTPQDDQLPWSYSQSQQA